MGKDGQGLPTPLRTVETPIGTIQYSFRRKDVKRLNLRVDRVGNVILTAPFCCRADQGDRFVREKYKWIASMLSRRKEQRPLLPELSRKEQYALLARSVARVYPLVQPFGVVLPQLKIRTMRSQWGNCHWAQGYITLNTALTRCPEGLRDYVALHELVHFLHHDHGRGFHETMDTLMPDWPARRRELKCYGNALEQSKRE